jgi:hypothetical protein
VAAGTSDRERARRVLNALRALPDGALEAALGPALDDNAQLLARVHAAMRAADPEGALADVLRDISAPGVPALDPPGALAAGEAIALTGTKAREALSTIATGQQELAQIGERVLVDALAADPSLVPLVEDALALLGDDGPFAALRASVETLGGIAEVFAAIQRGEPDVGKRVAKLRAERDALARVAPSLAEVPALLQRAIEHAEMHGDAKATARLAIAYAALHDDLDAWRDALDHAVDAELLPEARRAATRLEAAALASGRLEDVAELASQIGGLAGRLGDRDAELGAIGDQALVAAQLGLAGDARALLVRARELGDGPAREVRVHLLAGQIAERLGDESGARIELRKVMELARDAALDHELGWAALHLGRLEAKAGQLFRAGQDLELAQQLGRTLDDPSLLALAAAARIEAAADRTAAEAVLAQVDVLAPDARAELRARLETRWPARA